MVGVAGKSKGCATCRRRKIKCDEARPTCKRCLRSKLECAGYERYSVFIDRNQEGYIKRAPLEEVKQCSLQSQRLYSPEIEQVRLIAWFQNVWTGTHRPHKTLQNQVHWMSLIGPPSHPALQQALLAMSFAKWSQMESNPRLLQTGRNHYQSSLELAQRAICSRLDALSDDILATTCIMTLYELVDPSGQRLDNWLDHITGIGNMLCLRGPDHFFSAASRAILEHIRYIFMVRCLMTRTPCIFGTTKWRSLPWQGFAKSIEQQVFDQGLRLTILRKHEDLVSNDENVELTAHSILSTAVEMFETLDHLVAYISSDNITKTNATSLLSITALGIQLGSAISVRNLLAVAVRTVDSGNYATHTIAKAQNISHCCKQLARTILSSIETRSDINARALESLRLWWSLQLAETQFILTDPELERCQTLLALLAQCTAPFDTLTLCLDRHCTSMVYQTSCTDVQDLTG